MTIKKYDSLFGFFLWMLFLAAFIFCVLFCTIGCKQNTSPSYDLGTTQSDTTEVSKDTCTQSFSSAEEFINYKDSLVSERTTDSVISNLPNYVLYNVCNVLTKRQSTFTKTEVALEYLNNYTIYDNLNKANKSDTDDDYSDISEKDTIINGKKCKIITKIY